MRGAPGWKLNHTQEMRIIPADAGSTDGEHTLVAYGQDHPRGCGEHVSYIRVHGPEQGSSPRMRGAHGVDNSPVSDRRIIPADAGSTF